MRLGGVLAFAAGFVGAAVVVGFAAKSRLGPQGEAIQRRLATEGAAVKAEAEAYAAREQERIYAYGTEFGQKLGRIEADIYAGELGIPQMTRDLQRLQVVIEARRRTARQLVDEWNPFNLLR